ncbi:MAG: ATP-binding protein [Candidatus Marsarchaeota archaeon]|nr:ATP-binding protein [Candidatus Marsarchaeota archaeon]
MGSGSLAKLAVLPGFSEHCSADASEMSKEGAFIGSSEKSGMPFFFDPFSAINPHIFIAGMSGSGKTYLTKNLMLKLHSVLGHSVVLLDFTGEYLEFSEFASCTRYDFKGIGGMFSGAEPVLLYAGLYGMKPGERNAAALRVISELTEIMRSGHRRSGRMLFIILDEAWKLLLGDRSLATLIREGRKYGTGIILASQLIEDMELGMLSNIATLLVFRVQNKSSLKRLELNYQLGASDVLKVQGLGVGECLVVQLYKQGIRKAFFIKRVEGISIGKRIKLKRGVKMVEVSYKKLEDIVVAVSRSDPSELLAELSSNKAIDTRRLIAWLIRLGADRLAVLSGMRQLGISDADTADAFAMAIREVYTGAHAKTA